MKQDVRGIEAVCGWRIAPRKCADGRLEWIGLNGLVGCDLANPLVGRTRAEVIFAALEAQTLAVTRAS